MTENWKPVPGFPYYEASNLGNVRSLQRFVMSKHHNWSGLRQVPGKVLKPIPNRGYLVVKIARDGDVFTYGVHQVVAMAFHGMPPAGHVVDHVDTNKHNNAPDNLEYVTGGENTKRQYRTGLLTNQAGKVGRWKHLPAKA